MFKTISENTTAEIVEKKSKFIANVFYIETIEEAENKIKEIKKKYFDARHNCFAYSIFSKEGIINRFSDDGEPSGTAGVPMLNILNGNNLSNVLVVVTRYFGGILLGTGGLVRAYSLATTTAIEEAEILVQTRGLEAECFVGYNEFEELKYHLKNRNIEIINAEYAEKIKVIVEGKEEDINKLLIEKISDRITLENIQILRKKYISVEEK